MALDTHNNRTVDHEPFSKRQLASTLLTWRPYLLHFWQFVGRPVGAGCSVWRCSQEDMPDSSANQIVPANYESICTMAF